MGSSPIGNTRALGSSVMTLPYCAGTTKAGKPCQRPANSGDGKHCQAHVPDEVKFGGKVRCSGTHVTGRPCRGWAIKGTGLCMGHQPKEIQMEYGFDPANGKGGRRKPNALEIMRVRVEAEIDEILKPFFDGLTAEKALAVSGGYKEAGYVEYVDDPAIRMKAAEALLDRVYGKPKQTTELSGPDGGPVSIELPKTSERASDVARILAGAGALPSPAHDGRARRSVPAPARAVGGNGNGNGHGDA